MKNCEECNKKLSFYEGYRHPTLGKKSLVCGNCFDDVTKSVSVWADVVRANSLVHLDESRESSIHNTIRQQFSQKHSLPAHLF